MLKKPETILWKTVNNLWEKGKSYKDDIDTHLGYWKGNYQAPAVAIFSDQKKTSNNICKEIGETKLASVLDSPYTIAVLPQINVFADLSTIKDQQCYADVLHAEVQNILTNNKWENKKKVLGRWGMIRVGAIQTLFEDGEVKINIIDPRELKFDTEASSLEKTTWVGFESELGPDVVKEKYAKNDDGSINEEMVKKIDEITEGVGKNEKGKQKGITAFSDSRNNNSGLAFANERGGISAGKIVKLVCLHLKDTTVYMDKEDDSKKQKEANEVWRKKYPNGRIIIFSPNKDKKLVLEDKAAPKGFKGLYNIDLFNTQELDEMVSGEIDDIMPIQDRINGTQLKIRQLVAGAINSLALDKGVDLGVQEGDVVNHLVMFLNNASNRKLPIINNGSIEQAMKLLEYVSVLEQKAYSTARLNETMINGTRQTGTTSGDQVDSLNESPMTSIREIQDLFKEVMINVGEKILTFIQEYYTTQRLFEVSTGIYQKDETGKDQPIKYAQFVFKKSEDEKGDPDRYLELLDEAGNTVKSIKTSSSWKFKVEVSAGNEIPRTRKENSMLMEKLFSEGLLGDPNDLDIREQYLLSQDVPNARAFIAIQKRKKEELEKNPPKVTVDDVIQNKDLSEGLAKFIESLEYNSTAREFLLTLLGFPPETSGTDTVETAPAQTITSKADVKEVAVLAPNVVTEDPVKQEIKQEIAGAMIDQENQEKGVPANVEV